ncbi:sugar kinase [Haloprofundus marisrubri]|uniref:Pantoate kinase n=1 Tax=Haloprofundus marisrubri TaxID=1514971 RepID=A0A0W1R8F8_9EURY|nr:pantoate kinase [Haloprofundus marisrubri]KTG09645.1 sugar kinase [Haloprofundus marisrubri]
MAGEAAAFVPGHVTGFFSAHPDDDPRVAGSRGAGVTLSHGVTVRVRPAESTTVTLEGETIRVDPVERVLDALSVTATVDAETSLPLGAGFGVSGAMALGTALAANDAFERALSENELVTLAHGAEVQSGTGLGDVVAQAHGGVPIRLEPGAPGEGLLDGIPAQTRVEYVTFGELSTEDVLSGDTARLSEAGTRALSSLVERPTLDRFMLASRRFAREAGLLTDRVEEAIREVNAVDGEASMAMLGDSVFALGTGLSEAGYDPTVCQSHPAGARLLGDQTLPLESCEPSPPAPGRE